jgi:MFS family permease
MHNLDDDFVVPPTAPPLPLTVTESAAIEAEAIESAPDLPEVSSRYIWLLVAGQFGVFMAFITPLAISLAIRVNDLAPGREEYLGYITGVGAAVVMLTGPLLGVASDRTRSRLGRRRPFIIVGMVLGVVSLVVMALAPSVLVLALGWILAQLGWGQAFGGLTNSQADRLPESQRGKVAGLGGVATQIAPVFGVVIAGGVSGNPLLLFLIPGAFGVIGALLFVVFAHENDSRGIQFKERMTASVLLSKYVFNPRKFPDFSWNWLGRFFFYFGLTLNTTFTAFFFASRLGVPVDQVGGTIAAAGGIGVLATTAGALGGGFLSDKIKRRKPLIVFSGALMAVGMLTMAFSSSIVFLIVGSVIVSMGLGGFAAVDQALLLDVLPERETDAGRYMGIVGFAASIPQAAAPLIAPLILGLGAAGGEKNYTLLFIFAAGFVLLGGLIVLRIRSVR